MKKTLQDFDLICQNIKSNLVNQKTHGFLHNLRPFARTKRYIEQDFMDLWNKSCFKKFQYALDGAKINFTYTEITQDKGHRDIYQGTSRPGVLLRYKIAKRDQKYVITQMLNRLKKNSDRDVLATWRDYILQDIAQCENQKTSFSLPMQLHVIGRIKAGSGQNFQGKKDLQIQQFNSQGFDGNLYIWMDLSKYKAQVKTAIDKQKADQKLRLGYDPDEVDQLALQQIEQPQIASDNQQQIDIHLTHPSQDKFLIGKFEIIIKDSDKQGLLSIGAKILAGNLDDLIGKNLDKGFNRIRGMGNPKDSSEKPDIIRKKISLFGLSKPFVEVISTVTLQDWLYNVEENPERKYLGQDTKKVNETSLMKFPFEQRNIRKRATPDAAQNLDILHNKCFSVGRFGGGSKWEYHPITQEWLKNASVDHVITLKFEAWVKRHGGYYFQYRIVFDLKNFYQIKKNILGYQNRLNKLNNNHDEDNQQLKESLQEKINMLQKLSNNFNYWLADYFEKMSQYRPDVSSKMQVDKLLYNSQNQFVNRDAHIRTSLQALNGRDNSAYQYLKRLFVNTNWMCGGKTWNDFMNELKVTSIDIDID